MGFMIPAFSEQDMCKGFCDVEQNWVVTCSPITNPAPAKYGNCEIFKLGFVKG